MLDRKIAPPIKDAIEFSLKLRPYEKYILNNGVEVYAVNAGEQDVVKIDWVFDAGKIQATREGIALAANHLLKNGTVSKTAFEINEQFEYYGAHCARKCYTESALISLSGLSKHLEHLLPTIREMMSEAIFPQEELDIFIQNSKQRLAVNLKKCDFVAERLMDAYLFGEDHPYGSYMNAEDYDALNIETIKSFYEQHYRNGKCIIFIAGKLPATIEAMLNQYFGDLPITPMKNPFKELPPSPASQKKYRIANEENAVQGAIRLARHFPNRTHPDYKHAVVLNTVLGGFFGSRLMANIREDKGYTYGIGSYFSNYAQQCVWIIGTEAGVDVCEAAINEIYHEMDVLKSELVDEEELLLVKNYLIGSILGDLDGPFQIIARWKNIILHHLPEGYFEEAIQAIKDTTPQQIMELANKYLDKDDFYEIVVT